MCLYPKLIKNKKYTVTKKNGGRIPPISDDRTLYVPIGCGKCIECMKQKKRNWQVRLLEEIKTDRTGKFITFTFSEEAIHELENDIEIKNLNTIIDNEIASLAVRRFLERWRKKYKKSVKHWFITELGHNGTERIHIHGIIFTNNIEAIKDIWKYGHIWVGDYVNEKTINYIVKYCNKLDTDHKGYIPKIMTSAGIGKGYLKRIDSKINTYKGKNTIEYYKTSDGSKLNLPIYYRNKIYTEEERQNLWLYKLDKQTRYVCGEKVSVKDTETDYEKTLEYYRKLNKRLGYGDDSKEWEKSTYVENREKLRALNRYINTKKM
nr:MAG: replication initiator protein [Microvirus sp.]